MKQVRASVENKDERGCWNWRRMFNSKNSTCQSSKRQWKDVFHRIFVLFCVYLIFFWKKGKNVSLDWEKKTPHPVFFETGFNYVTLVCFWYSLCWSGWPQKHKDVLILPLDDWIKGMHHYSWLKYLRGGIWKTCFLSYEGCISPCVPLSPLHRKQLIDAS